MRRGALVAIVAAAALAAPASAWAHAALLRTTPSASAVLNGAPKEVAMTYSEAVEPRFAVVSITDAAGRPVAAGPPDRSPANPDTLVTKLKPIGEGWYLVYWRVISADGHPVRGAFTFALGPNPGPAPQFPIPSLSETAATSAHASTENAASSGSASRWTGPSRQWSPWKPRPARTCR